MRHRVVIIGTGFSGIGMAIRLKRAGMHDFVLLERAEDLGGTWRDNSYPGCQCDVPSNLYSYSFALKPDWSRTFPEQAEIWDYLRACAERFGVVPHIRFGHDVREAAWDEQAGVWQVDTTGGQFKAPILVSGIGLLTDPKLPDIDGIDRFEGTMFHSARWNHAHDLRGERVAVVGTGASAIQFVPRIQPQVGRLHVFQRTPPWVMPHRDRAVTEIEKRAYRRFPPLQRLVRTGVYWGRELLVLGFSVDRRFMKVPTRVARHHLEDQVPDPALRAKLEPDYEIGCKRILISNDYLPALVEPNVEVVTEGIREVRGRSIVTADGAEREVDTIIFGTGFRVTDAPVAERVRGADGRTLEDVWQGSPQAFLGTTVAGFPNFFMLLGPNTGLGHTSVVLMIESQLDYVMDALRAMERAGVDQLDVRPEVQAAYNDEIQADLRDTVWNTGGCRSWYLDRNGLNTALWPDFTFRFRWRTHRFRAADYVALRRERNGKPAAAAVSETPA